MAQAMTVKQVVPVASKEFPEGEFLGVWSGFEVSVVARAHRWLLSTDDGVRGINIGCKVTCKNGRIVVTAIDKDV